MLSNKCASLVMKRADTPVEDMGKGKQDVKAQDVLLARQETVMWLEYLKKGLRATFHETEVRWKTRWLFRDHSQRPGFLATHRSRSPYLVDRLVARAIQNLVKACKAPASYGKPLQDVRGIQQAMVKMMK